MENEQIGSGFYTGAMLGAAVGDAVGSFYANEKKKETPLAILRFGGLMQLAVFTAEGLLRATHRAKMHGTNGTFAEIIYESYLRWMKTQSVNYDDIVNLPEKDGWLIRRRELYHKGAPLKRTLRALKSKRIGDLDHPLNKEADFEALLPVLPVGLMFPGDVKDAFRIAAEAAALTHGAPEAYLSAGFYAALISSLVAEIPLTEAISLALKELETWPKHQKVKERIITSLYFLDETENDSSEELHEDLTRFENSFKNSIVAQDILAYSLYCTLRFQDDFREALLRSVRYKGAPEACGMLVGSLLGVVNGEESIPKDWLEALKHKDIVLQVADDLFTGIKGDIYSTNREWADKYPGY